MAVRQRDWGPAVAEPGADSASPPGEDAQPDAPLWAATLAGDADAFAALYDRHADAVHRVLVRRIGPTDARDLTAEVFERAWAHRERIRLAESGGLRPWLLGTALNVARGHVERASVTHRLTQRMIGWAAAEADPLEAAVDALDDAAALTLAQAALASLSVEDQEVLVLCVLEGLTPNEAAAALDQRPGTVRSRLSRARRRLAAAYEKSCTKGSRV